MINRLGLKNKTIYRGRGFLILEPSSGEKNGLISSKVFKVVLAMIYISLFA